MAKKTYTEIVDLTWSGDTITRTILGKQIEFSSANETWNKTIALWTDDVVAVIERLLIGGSRGGIRTKQDTWNAWDKIGEKNKKKIVRVIMTLKNVRHIAEQDINEYKVTIEDIELVLEEYEKFKVTIEDVEII